MIDLHARVAVLEDQNETCEEERKQVVADISNHTAVLNQIKGGIKLLVVLWTIAVALLGAREVFPRVVQAAPFEQVRK